MRMIMCGSLCYPLLVRGRVWCLKRIKKEKVKAKIKKNILRKMRAARRVGNLRTRVRVTRRRLINMEQKGARDGGDTQHRFIFIIAIDVIRIPESARIIVSRPVFSLFVQYFPRPILLSHLCAYIGFLVKYNPVHASHPLRSPRFVIREMHF